MHRVLAKLGYRLAIDRSYAQRRRALLVGLACAVFAASVLASISFFTIAVTNERRDVQRTPVVEVGDSSGVPLVGDSLPIVDGRQFQVSWLAAGPRPVIDEFSGPPPEPGYAFASPALLESLGGSAGLQETLGLKLSDRNDAVRWDEILAFAGEYLVFATLPDGIEVASDQSLVGFGPRPGITIPPVPSLEALALGVRPIPQEPFLRTFPIDERVPSPSAAAFAAAFLLLVPGLMVLGVGVSTKSESLRERHHVLSKLGCPRMGRLVVDGVEIATIALVPVVAVCSLWWIAVPSVTRLPGGRLEFLPGDSWPGAPWIGLSVGVSLLVPVLLAPLGRRVAARRSQRQRRRTQRFVGPIAATPIALVVATSLLPAAARVPMFMAVCLSVVLVAPVLPAAALPIVGSLVHSDYSASRRIAAARLNAREPRLKAFMTIGLYAAFATTLVLSISVQASLPSKQTFTGDSGLVTATWAADSVESATLLQAELPDLAIATIALGNIYIDSCEELASLAGTDVADCVANAETALRQASAGPLGALGRPVVGMEVPPMADRVSIVARVDDQETHDRLQAALNSNFGPSQVLGWNVLGPHPFAGWIGPLGLAALGLLGLALLIGMLNVVGEPSPSDRALDKLQASEKQQRSIVRWSIHPAAACGTALGTGYGWLTVTAGRLAEITDDSRWRSLTGAAGVWLVMIVSVEVSLAVGSRFAAARSE